MPSWVEIYLSASNPYFYPVVFLSLYAAGLGAPISSDLVLLTVGYLAYQGQAEYSVLIPLGILATMCTDTSMYWIARRYGRRLATKWPLKTVLTPERIVEAEKSFHIQGYRMVFLARFMVGIRTVFMFSSGLLRLNYWKFIAHDFTGALITIPLTIYSVKWFAGNIAAIRGHMEKGQTFILSGVIAVIAVVVFFKIKKKKRKPVLGSKSL